LAQSAENLEMVEVAAENTDLVEEMALNLENARRIL